MSSVEIVELSENDEDDDCVLESVIYKDPDTFMNKDELIAKTINSKNPLVTEFVKTCINLENSQGMKRVINRTFLNMYTKADKKFKESLEFEKALRRATNLVKTDPSHKFSHVKDLCEIIRSGNVKKRVQFITLSYNTKASKLSACKRKSETERNSKIKKTEIIDLDSIEEESTFDLDNTAEGNLTPDYICANGEKENDDTCNENKNVDENKLLIPHKELEFHKTNQANKENIKKIEEEIAMCKKMIAELDEKEVCNDSMNSPYIQSEKYKARIVSLYNELCKLTGEEAVKRAKIHLNVLDGHPAGPVRRLEKFLNRNVGSDGNPPFPSFRDVVKCVLKANEKESLGWSKQQIINEARALFTHCGRALQKRRQRREWRDLLSKVKVEDCGEDPADKDPELLARLEANKRDALKKESEILERYSMMQNAPPQKDTAVFDQVKDAHDCSESDNDMDSSSDESSCNKQTNTRLTSQIVSSNDYEYEDVAIKEENSEINVIKIKKEPESNIGQLLEELGDNYTTTVVEIEDSFVSVEISDSSDED